MFVCKIVNIAGAVVYALDANSSPTPTILVNTGELADVTVTGDGDAFPVVPLYNTVWIPDAVVAPTKISPALLIAR